MNVDTVLQALLLVATALGVGWLVVPPGREGPLPGRAGTAGLVGLCTLAAGMTLLGTLGPPAWGLFVLAWAAAGAGWWRVLRGGWKPGGSPAGEALVLAFVAVLGFVPLLLALAGPPQAYDVLGSWWPGGLQVAREGLASPSSSIPLHLHPEYPRGPGWLFALGAPGSVAEAQLLRVISWLFWVFAALALLDLGARLGTPRAGRWAALLWLALPDAAAWGASGMADVPLAGALLLAGTGITLFERDGRGCGLVLAGALGACCIKEEGYVVWAAVAVWALVQALRGRLPWPRSAALLLLPAAALGLWWRSGSVPAGAVSSLGALRELLAEPALLLQRLVAFPEVLGQEAGGHFAQLVPGIDGPVRDGWPAMLVTLGALLVVLPRGRTGIRLLPLWALLVMQWGAILVTPLEFAHQVGSTVNRLCVQLVPLLVFAATQRLLGEEAEAAHQQKKRERARE